MKPILFNTEMVKAILDGRKTVTRRLVKPQPTSEMFTGICTESTIKNDKMVGKWFFGNDYGEAKEGIKPHYKIGDILYVRETWQRWDESCENDYIYKACDKECAKIYENISIKWHPSIHMPKEAARIFLKVTDVRVEKLQNINCPEAEKEGCTFLKEKNSKGEFLTERGVFKELWDSTIKKQDIDEYGWEANPWVWIIEFERCENPEVEK